MQIKQVASMTRPGASRDRNEDAVLSLDQVPVFAVADGMGGAGDVASKTAMDVVRANAALLSDQVRKVGEDRSSASRLDLGVVLESTFQWAHLEVQREADRHRAHNLATTLVVAAIAGDHAYIAHVGNSRAYLWRAGRVQRLTDDHSVGMLRYRSGKMSLAELQSSPEQHRLTQVLGAGLEIDVDTAEAALADDDVVLLCSDGLFQSVSDETIAAAIDVRDVEASVRRLVSEASHDPRHDDISVMLIRVGSERDNRSIEEIAGILRAVFLFRDLSEQDRLVIAPYLEERVYKRGDVLAREGEQGDEFFVLVDGTVRITRGRAHLVDIGPGGHLGELSLTRPTPRSATATAQTKVRLFALSRQSFDALLRRRPGLGARIALALLDTVGDRLRDLTNRLSMVERITRGDVLTRGLQPMEAVARAARGELHDP